MLRIIEHKATSWEYVTCPDCGWSSETSTEPDYTENECETHIAVNHSVVKNNATVELEHVEFVLHTIHCLICDRNIMENSEQSEYFVEDFIRSHEEDHVEIFCCKDYHEPHAFCYGWGVAEGKPDFVKEIVNV